LVANDLPSFVYISAVAYPFYGCVTSPTDQ
jgi:hypothetical protein